MLPIVGFNTLELGPQGQGWTIVYAYICLKQEDSLYLLNNNKMNIYQNK